MQATVESIAKLIEIPDSVIYGIASTTYSIFGVPAELLDTLLKTFVPAIHGLAHTYTASNIHPLSLKLPLMNPSYVLFAVIAYLVLLLALYPIGQAIGACKLKTVGIIHNAFLFSLSFYMWAGILITAAANGYTLWNNGVGSGDNSWRMAKLVWIFYVSKLPEFIDTVIMMLKHNYRQVSFLHLYHHGTIFVIWFIVVMEGPGGDAYFSAMLNSGVHVVMYGYYLGTSLFPTGPIRRALNSIKFFITYGQMTQFATNCVQSAYLLLVVPKPHYPSHLIKLLLVYMFTLLALFGNFLIQNQGKAQKGDDKKKRQ